VFVKPGQFIRLVSLALPGQRLPVQPVQSNGCTNYILFAAVREPTTDIGCLEYLFDWESVRDTLRDARQFGVSVTAVIPVNAGVAGPTFSREIRKEFRIKRDQVRALK
jgi:hypothetical protein